MSYLGAALNCELTLGATVLRADLPARNGLRDGTEISVHVDSHDVTIVLTD